MIRSFGNKLAESLFHRRRDGHVRKFPVDLERRAAMMLQLLQAAGRIDDLRTPPGNRLEKLQGDLRGCWSVRINDQWRIVFRWQDGAADDVRVVDYH